MTTTFKTSFAGMISAVLLGGPLAALPLSEIEKRDFNGNGAIDRGAELEALKLVFPDLDDFQQTRFGTFVATGAAQMKLSEFSTADDYSRLRTACRIGKRFTLQENVSQISLHNQDAILPSKNGALFSISRDRINDLTSWQVNGAMAWVPKGAMNRCLLDDKPNRPVGAVVSAYGFAPFISFKGSGNSTAKGTSDLSVGVIAQIQVFGGAFDLQEYTFAPYYRTDFQGDAEIYGIKASWTPYHYESRLNGLQGDVSKRRFDWSLGVNVDYFKVHKAGNSGLIDDTDYGFVGANLGVGYTMDDVGAYGVRFSAGVDAHRDILNDISAIKYNVSAKMHLTEDARTSLELSYEKGRDRSTLTDVDGVTLNLRISF
ncbi:hypothetical protein [Sulfitobacter geojensis]|uniref:Uncharacterized protein n=1 Tax=Sulfitobacter geojensis TaxID=1342299 RepID=A0AAE2W1S2_9RHOB|nr:hypothetical protein [Sulfitobacter geojensis]MBM1691606.1 hypothetical protein [Sulfitobacter geojensis]MBM1695672.1 hypothetical protein [Sulfitobacter geojensis]MBM1707837.1 hypothetical protein [Sulfitobacter geojensis]MBM1711896.1 hypothetical protein [Sulfitobacter geojensis]MBM1715961.1 hypothetical protein [Sulfitobacter geojensis]